MLKKKCYFLFSFILVALSFGLVTTSADTVTRLYNQGDGNHWFTTSSSRTTQLMNQGWIVEGVAFEAASSGNPVYVVTSPTGYYHFTSNTDEINGLVNLGWTKGEVVF